MTNNNKKYNILKCFSALQLDTVYVLVALTDALPPSHDISSVSVLSLSKEQITISNIKTVHNFSTETHFRRCELSL